MSIGGSISSRPPREATTVVKGFNGGAWAYDDRGEPMGPLNEHGGVGASTVPVTRVTGEIGQWLAAQTSALADLGSRAWTSARLGWGADSIPDNIKPFHAFYNEGGITKNILVGPTQGGKSFSGAREVIWQLRGEHPLKPVKQGATNWWALNVTARQSIAIQKVVLDLIPRHWAVSVDFNDTRGFVNRMLQVHNVSGSISTLEFKTAGEDGLGLASATIDGVWPDEPYKQEHHNELIGRISVKKGTLLPTLTCVNAPVAFLRDDVELGKGPSTLIQGRNIITGKGDVTIAEHYRSEGWHYTRFALHPDNCPHLSARQIRELARSYLRSQLPQRIWGLWDGVSNERYISYDPDVNFVNKTIDSLAGWEFAVGIDHGERVGAQTAVLIAFKWHPVFPQVHVIDSISNDKPTTAKQDAEAIAQMLARNGLTVYRLAVIVGDTNSAGKDYAGASVNAVLSGHLSAVAARMEGIPEQFAIRVNIESALKRPGSFEWGCRLLSYGMTREDITVAKSDPQGRPRNAKLDKSLRYWKGTDRGDDHALKHVLDALRYVTVRCAGDGAGYRAILTAGGSLYGDE